MRHRFTITSASSVARALSALDYAEHLRRHGDTAASAAAISEARDIAGRLRCQPLLDRAETIQPTRTRPPASDHPFPARA
jgi:hypothetical protein